jgi:hypothetical protein
MLNVIGSIAPISRATVLALIVTVGIVAPVAALDWGWKSASADDEACDSSKPCVVAGAEVDDAATIKARAQTGTGPAAGLASDRRVKTDICQVATLDNGLKIYAFKFLWEDKVRVGVIAQDLLERADTKGAVLTLANGLLGVDYAALGLRMATEQQWQQGGVSALKADYKPTGSRAARFDEPVRLFNRRPGS